GAGGSGADLNLDTNSGILSRLSWNGSSWDKLDLVRGLPRSEENHASNGIQLDEATNTIYIAQGGLTNMGAPSNNFADLPEFALSAAILSVDLDTIGETTYDIPTLDDDDQPGADATDPFGGNDGQNQALLVPGGPVQVHAPGFRNPYDVLITESGRMYTIDNGPNAGWGGTPNGEGPGGNATNDPKNGGSTHDDGLHFVSGPGYYGGHPNPTRSNPNNTFNDLNPQSPVSVGNPVESDYRKPGDGDGALHVWGSSTNGLTEYTASNFQGSLRGDLLAASFNNSIKRVKTNAAGDAVVLEEQLFTSAGSVPLDVTAVADDGLFPGTVWVAAIGSGKIHVFEPADYGGTIIVSGDGDDQDGDGYTDDDEIANGTSPTNAADFPPDHDEDFISNLLDPDDDNDSLLDTTDRFAIDANNGLTTPIGVSYNWENEGSEVGGLINAGFTGLMTNNVNNYEDLFDPGMLTSGGAAGVLTLDEISAGNATGSLNSQEQAFQLGVNVASAVTPVTAHTRILAPFASETPQGEQSMGLFIGNGDQDNYFKIVIGATGISTQLEVLGSVINGPTDVVSLPGPGAIDLYLTIDVSASSVQASYEIDGGGRINLGLPVLVPSIWLTNASQGMAAGIISTSHGSAPPIPATWDLIEVVAEAASNLAPILAPISPQTLSEGENKTVVISANDPDGNNIALDVANLPSWSSFVDHGSGAGTLTLTPGPGDAGSVNLNVIATDDGDPILSDSQNLTVTVNPPVVAGEVVYRVNAGGPAISDSPTWTTDSDFTNTSAAKSKTYSNSDTINMSHPSMPVGTPSQLFESERYDQSSGAEMQWDFVAAPGLYEVRLYFAETYGPTSEIGERVFDVAIEGETVLDNYDIFADAGASTAVMKSFIVQTDGNIDIDFDHVVQHPQVRAIEILTAGFNPDNLLSSDTVLVFGNVTTGDSATQSIVLTNQGGTGDPTISVDTADLAISGSGAAAYSVTTTGMLSLAPGQSADIGVRFMPSATGTEAANLSIVHSGVNSPLPIALTGSGVDPAPTSASAFVEINGGGSLSSSSTYGSGSFKIDNNSLGGQQIETIRFDIDTALLPDVAFDPDGAAGDPVGKGFSPTSGSSATGLSGHSFEKPLHLGYQALEVAFSDFDPGEKFTFAVDIDPTTIRGASAPGPNAAGSVSGLELAGSLVTVTFDDGSTLTSELFREPGSETSGVVTVEEDLPAAPGLQLLGVSSTPTVLAVANQVVRVSATPGSTVRLMHVEAALHLSGVPGGGFDIDPFESNKIIGLSEQTLTVGGSGIIDVPVTLLDTHADGGLNHIAAAVIDGGRTSDMARVLVEYDSTAIGNIAPILNFISDSAVTAGDTQSILISATDPNGDNVSLDATGMPAWATLTDHGNNTATLALTPQAADVGSVVINVIATDDGTPVLSDNQLVTVTVEDEIIVDPNIDHIVYRVNAGGPELSGTPAWTTDSGFTNTDAASSKTFSKSSAIDMGHGSLPTDTPQALFQTERWDSGSGQEMQWDFSVTPGTYEVRLYFAEIYSGAQGVGERVFDVAIEGATVLDNYDTYADVGGFTGVMKSFIVNSDANLDIDFDHVTQNPAVKGIEIIAK
ncbi:MAG: malectin domain-containing carbohydrate-binding protein, partial [Aeoliella sp.]